MANSKKQIPLFIEKDKDGFYVIECPILPGCYSQAKSLDGALKNIREVIKLILMEKEAVNIIKTYEPREISLHTITV